MAMKHILDLAKQIESAALNLPDARCSSNSSIYKEKIRSLYQNLKNRSNPGLRKRILQGDVTPARFVTMSHEEMKSKQQREEDMKIAKENMNNAMVAQEEKSVSTSLECGKCHQKKVSYSQAQTRSADEPMTTFCECMNCGNRWKFS
jgi:transcription elongation factor S-II